MKRILILIFFLCVLISAKAQWTIQPSIGVAMPMTAYSSIADKGLLVQFDFNTPLKNSKRWSIGGTIAWGMMHQDSNSKDMFTDAQLDQVPILVTIDYIMSTENKIVPYAGFGLGMSLSYLNFIGSSTYKETLSNASVGAMPKLGVRMNLNDHWYPFVEGNWAFVMDGIQEEAVDNDQVTGYFGLVFGVGFRLNKSE